MTESCKSKWIQNREFSSDDELFTQQATLAIKYFYRKIPHFMGSNHRIFSHPSLIRHMLRKSVFKLRILFSFILKWICMIINCENQFANWNHKEIQKGKFIVDGFSNASRYICIFIHFLKLFQLEHLSWGSGSCLFFSFLSTQFSTQILVVK